MNVIAQLQAIRQIGGLPSVCYHFAEFVCRKTNRQDDALLFFAAALASHAVETANVCADLPALSQRYSQGFPSYEPDRQAAAADNGKELPMVALPEINAWLAHLRTCRDAVALLPPDGQTTTTAPLIMDVNGRLYLQRYYDFEQRLAVRLRDMAADEPALANRANAAQTADALALLFQPPSAAGAPPNTVNWQKIAGFAALRRQLAIITGGPGTGKTTVVVRLLALIQQLCASETTALRILVAAPTGKAAARLNQAIEEGRQCLARYGVNPDAIQVKASTIHRLLGSRRNTIHFRHNAGNPLQADLVVIDEASMVPLPMMCRIVDAVPQGARLILLGDRYQLASIESGYVLGDICAGARAEAFSAAFRQQFALVGRSDGDSIPETAAEPAPLSDCCVQLAYSWRFPPGSQIAQVSEATNAGGNALRAATAELKWLEPQILVPIADIGGTAETTVVWKAVPTTLRGNHKLPDRLFWENDNLFRRYQSFLNATEPAEVLAAFEQFRILCATRTGTHGVDELNRLVEQTLALDYMHDRNTHRQRLRAAGFARLLPAKRDRFYDHQPIMVTENHYGLGLFNGDIGVILQADTDAADNNSSDLRAYFPGREPGQGPRAFLPMLLPTHQTAFAMTIHKSQGSQFPDVLVVLPHHDNPVLSRELVYTAITRASRRVEIWAEPQLFSECLRRTVRRHSGLLDALQR